MWFPTTQSVLSYLSVASCYYEHDLHSMADNAAGVMPVLVLLLLCSWEASASPYTVTAAPPPTVLQHLRQVFGSMRRAIPGELSYNVTEVCSEGVLRGVCSFAAPQCINGTRCGISETRGDGWGWILPQDEREFVATFTDGSAFLTEPGVCGTGYKRFNESHVSKGKTIVNGRIVNIKVTYAAVSKTIPICCPGYNVTSEYRCAPGCSGGCKNGTCTATGHCSCLEGYVKNHQSHCVPRCRKGCKNGDCTAPGHCTCRTGYVKNAPFRCVPHCAKGCKHGDCTGPDTCTCRPGYKKVDNNPKCVPHCPGGCDHGKCVRPGHCECEQGYLKDISGDCVSFCSSGCENGQCVGPNDCVCNDGYRRDNTLGGPCRPHCADGCSNGQCTAPNQCTCNAGYKKKNGNGCVSYCFWGDYQWGL